MLNIEDSILVIIDEQEKLLKAADKSENIVLNTSKLVKASDILTVPVVVTEQYPQGLGKTSDLIKNNLSNEAVYIEKSSFSAYKEPEFSEKINFCGRKKVIICGIETHICVLQTSLELSENGYDVFVVQDCCCSRQPENHNTAIELLKQYGIRVVSTEIVLFEWLKTSKHPKFKEVQSLII